MADRTLQANFSANTAGFTQGTNALRQRLTELNTSMEQTRQAVRNANQQVREYQKELRQLQQATQNGNTATSEQRSRMQELCDRIAQTTSQLGTLRTAEQDLRGQIRNANAELNNQQTALQSVTNNAATMGQVLKAKGDMTSRFNAYSTALQNNIMSIDEIRYRENLPPLGFNYMKLNLADVLYDPKSGDIITPNTGVIQRTDGSGLTHAQQGGIIEPEVRKKDNYAQDPKTGKMIGSVPMGGGAAGKAKPVRLSKGEYRKIVSEINTNYGKYQGKDICYHHSVWKDKYFTYKFVNNGFDNYSFIEKWGD